ncbi:MAG: hypothetical protein VB124_05985 [Burkholderia sp.]
MYIGLASSSRSIYATTPLHAEALRFLRPDPLCIPALLVAAQRLTLMRKTSTPTASQSG